MVVLEAADDNGGAKGAGGVEGAAGEVDAYGRGDVSAGLLVKV